MGTTRALVLVEKVESRIHTIRGQRVILDADLAALYGVSTKVLNQAVKRNPDRFLDDFMFRLSDEETDALRSQIVTSKGRGGRRYLPYAFTEHGAIMAANVLNSRRAIEASVYVVRAFVKLREDLASHRELAGKLEELERRLDTHDRALRSLIATIKQLASPTQEERERIGFTPPPRDGAARGARGRRLCR